LAPRIDFMLNLTKVVETYIATNKLNEHTPGLGFQYSVANQIKEELYVGRGDIAQATSRLSRNSSFQICSITKIFVGLLLLKLEEKKVFDPETTLGDYFNDAPLRIRALKLKELIFHTSGLIDYLTIIDPEFFAEGWQTEKALDLIWRLNPEAGASRGRYQYCNTGFFLLGEIVQKITGVKWFESLEEQILRPLGIKKTYSAEQDRKNSGTIEAYEGPYGQWKPRSACPYLYGWAEGNLVSNFDDLQKLSLVFESDVLFKQSSLRDKLRERSVIVEGETFYSWGFQILEKHDKTWFMHGGGSDGIHTLWIYCPKTRELILSYANHMMRTEADPRNNLNHALIDHLDFKFDNRA